jgi:hypothetical protein
MANFMWSSSFFLLDFDPAAMMTHPQLGRWRRARRRGGRSHGH